jgi:hypothetical protein
MQTNLKNTQKSKSESSETNLVGLLSFVLLNVCFRKNVEILERIHANDHRADRSVDNVRLESLLEIVHNRSVVVGLQRNHVVTTDL